MSVSCVWSGHGAEGDERGLDRGILKEDGDLCLTVMSDSKLTPKEQAEQEDRKLLTEINAQIQEIMQLLGNGESQESATKKIDDARKKVRRGGGGGATFHPYKGTRTPVTQESSDFLHLGDALELALKTKKYDNDLNKALKKLTRQRIVVLERLLGRT